MNKRWLGVLGALSVMASLLLNTSPRAAEAQVGAQVTSFMYLPLVMRSCSATGQSYAQGIAYQQDTDNPVRPAYNHADKNLALRSYSSVSQFKGLVQVPPDPLENKNPPQFTTLFSPGRLPTFSNTYATYNWNWGSGPPDPGTRGSIITSPAVTALGFQTTPGETLIVPVSDYDIGGGMEVIVLFADSNSITFKYTREDSVQPNGYTLHVDNICTDSSLLALYNSLDSSSGPRYFYANAGFHGYSYNLPNLPAGQPFGTAAGAEVVVAIADTGAFLDPRSCSPSGFDFWEIGATCP